MQTTPSKVKYLTNLWPEDCWPYLFRLAILDGIKPLIAKKQTTNFTSAKFQKYFIQTNLIEN